MTDAYVLFQQNWTNNYLQNKDNKIKWTSTYYWSSGHMALHTDGQRQTVDYGYDTDRRTDQIELKLLTVKKTKTK